MAPRPLWLQLYQAFRRGWNEIPETYVSVVGLVFCGGGMYWSYYRLKHWGELPVRYKKCYTIFRPDDEWVARLPRHYITDHHLLPADHPPIPEPPVNFALKPW